MDYTDAPIELIEVSNYLQKIMKKKIGNFDGEKALYFDGETAKNSLLRFEYFNYVSSFDNEKQNNDPDHQFLPAIECVEDAEKILNQLLEYHLIQAVTVEENISRHALPVITAKPENNKQFELNQNYVWNYVNTMENKVKLFLVICIASVFLVIALIFSRFYKRIYKNHENSHHITYDVILALVETFAYIAGMAGLFLLIRVIVFEITKKMWNGRGLKVLPDLFADCSFKERFIPVYQFAEAKLQKLEDQKQE
ncbi:hypothetical protein BCR32DRAFT_289938 [Anaeromyces robustus]|uniref:Translocation protein SEC62 n=1 Tax=Anaeromyces robustus TaxID=1754192 RepID=A0A1Y1XL64_9FUNG|nr:hypothetical protein BCR32DRAFT_289938 [Anaeromyces robustus]|eukprot:ORX86509.1 hypothetical protein BCR32DRAFT_289938 [Anaeromyces robustus]